MTSHEYYMQTIAKERLASRRQEAAVHRAVKLNSNRPGLFSFLRDRLSAVPGVPGRKSIVHNPDGNCHAATS